MGYNGTQVRNVSTAAVLAPLGMQFIILQLAISEIIKEIVFWVEMTESNIDIPKGLDMIIELDFAGFY